MLVSLLRLLFALTVISTILGMIGTLLCYPKALGYALRREKRGFWKHLPPRFRKLYLTSLTLVFASPLLGGGIQLLISRLGGQRL